MQLKTKANEVKKHTTALRAQDTDDRVGVAVIGKLGFDNEAVETVNLEVAVTVDELEGARIHDDEKANLVEERSISMNSWNWKCSYRCVKQLDVGVWR